MPSYFMPEDDYSPMWHIGFARWLEEPTMVVKGFHMVKKLRAEGKVEINEFPPPAIGLNNFDFDHPNPPHVVNCPVPMTLDVVIHKARQLEKQQMSMNNP